MSYDDEMYGEDLPRDARRWARQELGNEVSQLRQQVAQQAVEASRQRCMNALDADPELRDKWRKLNNDPEFLKWLGEIYELAGVPRMQLLRQAYDVGDQWRVANFFRGYLTSKIPPRMRTETRLPLEQSPRVAVREADVNNGKKIWTGKEIRQFYQDKSARSAACCSPSYGNRSGRMPVKAAWSSRTGSCISGVSSAPRMSAEPCASSPRTPLVSEASRITRNL